MKNKKEDKNSLFNKKGFYVALYSCIGVVLVLTVAISFENFRNVLMPKEPQNITAKSTEEPLAEVGLNKDKPIDSSRYLTPDDKVQVELGDQIGVFPSVTGDNSQITASNETAFGRSTPKPNVPAATAAPLPAATQAPVSTTPASIPSAAPADSQSSLSVPVTDSAPAEDTVQTNSQATASETYAYFTDDSKMEWPVSGEIVMDFNISSFIYDKTLDVFRTNDNICIGAPVGTPVKAAADGIVTNVYKTMVDGNIVVVDNGNGWSTTYSQLQDGV